MAMLWMVGGFKTSSERDKITPMKVSRRSVGVVVMILGFLLGTKTASAISDEYLKLTVAVIGLIGFIVGLWLIYKRPKKTTETP